MNKIIQLFQEDQQLAFDNKDPNAGLCCVASVDESGKPRLRTLILRACSDEGFLVFTNGTSSKWKDFSANPDSELLVYWPSVKIQYRISGEVFQASSDVIMEGWKHRPANNKILDLFYATQQAQGTPVESRQAIDAQLEQFRQSLPEDALNRCPETNVAFHIKPVSIERLQLSDDGIHDRKLFTITADQLDEQVLWP